MLTFFTLFHHRFPSILVLLLLAIGFLSGCSTGSIDEEGATSLEELVGTNPEPETSRDSPPQNEPKVAIPIQPEGLTEPYVPYVFLSEQHRATCLVGVGDILPEGRLPNLHGESQKLSELYGSKVTVVILWTPDQAYAREQFLRMSREWGWLSAKKEVVVLSIGVGTSVEEVTPLAAAVDSQMPLLLDEQGGFFDQLATERLPRTYVLDAEGRILWHDLEYSRTTAREAINAVRFALLP